MDLEDEERAEAFIEINWQVLGSGWRPFGLYSDRLAYVLESYAEQEEVEWVVLDLPAVPAAEAAEAAGRKEVDAAEVRRFLEVLRGLWEPPASPDRGTAPQDHPRRPEEAGQRPTPLMPGMVGGSLEAEEGVWTGSASSS